MKIKKLEKEQHYCACCDDNFATHCISHNGSFKLYWACSSKDEELPLCDRCAKTLYSLLGEALKS